MIKRNLMLQKNAIPTSLIVLAMCYTVFLLLCYLFVRKELYFPFHMLGAAGMLVAPIALMLMDVIVEVFGYQVGKQIFWSSIFIQAVFCLVAVLLAYLPGTNAVHGGVPTSDYHAVFGVLPKIFILSFVAMLIGSWVNIRLIAKWKFLLRGRFFWIRSIGASAIGDGLFILLGTFMTGMGVLSLSKLFEQLVTAYVIEMSAIIILSPFSAALAAFLKHYLADYISEHQSLEFNPFREESSNAKN